jgi:subtilisin family serine protease
VSGWAQLSAEPQAHSTIIIVGWVAVNRPVRGSEENGEMLPRYSQRPRHPLGFHEDVVPVAAAMIAALIWFGLASPVSGEETVTAPPYDRGVLSDIAHDVLRRGATGPDQSVPESISPAADAQESIAGVGSGPDSVPDVAHIAPARETVSVTIPPTASAPRKVLPKSATPGHQSNSWRQAPPETARSLSFSSGVLARSSGLDPALKAHADGLRAQGRPSVYGFLLLRVPPQGIETKLEGLGVKLLGPHDDHQKVRLPVGSLQAVAALAAVEWLGVSAPEQKLSPELSELLGPQKKAAAADSATPLPIVVNLFEGDDSGSFGKQLEAAGAVLGEYDADLQFYRAVATGPAIEKIAALDFVLFIELIRPMSPGHDQSTPLIDADIIRPGGSFLPRFGGAATRVGILDTGAMIGGHMDLNKFGCGRNFTTDAAGAFNDEHGHGTHVLATIAGTGTANRRYRGVAPDVGSTQHIRVGKVFASNGKGNPNASSQVWMENGMDWMAETPHCEAERPHVINISGGAEGTGQTGTDVTSRKLDDKVFFIRQSYVVCGGNTGPGSQTIWSPGVAKNALTVGNAIDNGYLSVGVINNGSSRGPTGDGRMKPNLVAPGTNVTSARAGTSSEYVPLAGCSMATPHVTGLAATLMEHYPEFRDNPALLRAHMMASAIAHADVTRKSNDYGLGQVSGYLEHWARLDANGWNSNWFWGGVNASAFQAGDITVPAGTQRLVIVLTWDEPAASAGASRAVTYDLDLWVDHNADCSDPRGACGEYQSVSGIDNVEYVVVDNPPAGTYRLKVTPFNAPSDFTLHFGMASMIIRGDPTPPLAAFLSIGENIEVGSTFGVDATVSAPSYVASGVQVEPTLIPLGVTLLDVTTTRWDGVTMSFLGVADALTLGNTTASLPRNATWLFRADTPGPKTFKIRAWSDNGGEVTATRTVVIVPPLPDLVETALSTNPPAPARAPGTTFSVTDTVQNSGMGRSGPSTTRYYLSLDRFLGESATLLTGSRSVSDIDVGASRSGGVTVTIPAATPLNAYFLLACADDLRAVAEKNENNNCIASATPIVTVAGNPDLVATAATTNPAAPTTAPGATFSVTDTVQNIGGLMSASSKTRYYLSLDGLKSADDRLLTGNRGVPELAAGASHSGTVTVTVPPATPLNTYYLLTCADDLNAVSETNEGNNCIASAGATVTVARPDLVENAVSAPPATRARHTSFKVTDTVHNLGTVASGPSTTRYYLSLDGTKGAGDTLLTGGRGVPSLAAGASQSGTVTVTIPLATAPDIYFLLACADNANTIVETDETNNCKASSATMTVIP